MSELPEPFKVQFLEFSFDNEFLCYQAWLERFDGDWAVYTMGPDRFFRTIPDPVFSRFAPDGDAAFENRLVRGIGDYFIDRLSRRPESVTLLGIGLGIITQEARLPGEDDRSAAKRLKQKFPKLEMAVPHEPSEVARRVVAKLWRLPENGRIAFTKTPLTSHCATPEEW